MHRVTIKDVAREAAVSISTVSHVINETRYVHPDTKKRVLDALDNLGYRPNNVARSLRSGRTRTIGLILPDASNQFFAEVARRIENYGFQHGYNVFLGNSDNDSGKELQYINTLLAKSVDGIIFISAGSELTSYRPFIDSKIPVVVADRVVPVELADVVLVDNENGGYIATCHLIELGHANIGCITGPHDLSPSMQRFDGYKRALKDAGIPYRPELVVSGDFRIQGGSQAMERLLCSPLNPSAVFICNDMMALGAMNCARRHGLSIPADVSIVGFDDIELAATIYPPLTTVAQPIDELAACATSLLIERLQGTRTDSNRVITLPVKLIVRESTARKKI
jgi:LacI family transcriptional regulator